LKCKIAAQPSVDEVVVPNVFPSFVVIIVLGGVMDIVKRDHRADALDILEAGFLGILDLGRCNQALHIDGGRLSNVRKVNVGKKNGKRDLNRGLDLVLGGGFFVDDSQGGQASEVLGLD